METIDTIIAKVDQLKPSTYSDEQKAAWLIELDGKIYLETMKGVSTTEPPKEYPKDGAVPLLVGWPFDNIYVLYLIAMIDYSNQEIANYNVSAAMFDAAFSEFKKYWMRTHRAAPSKGFIY